MNKTLNINLGGLFYHIDENAYAKLKHYLDAINNSLQDDPNGKQEIIKDIEQRISEIFSSKITKERQVINENDVDEVIGIMGQPEDYQYDDELFDENKFKSRTQKNTHKNKKLYRSGKDRILGGVAAGLAHYIGMDPTWMRIIWIILIFPGGLSAWVYIVLWLIVPEARTTAEELEMKGEPVTIDNIEKKIKSEYTRIENNLKNADYSGVKNGFQQILDTFGSMLQFILKFLGKFIGIIILIIATVTLIGLVITLFSWGTIEVSGFSQEVIQYPEFFEMSVIPKWVLSLTFIFALIIPFIFLFILGLNIISQKKIGIGFSGNLALIGLWVIALITLIFAGIENGSHFSQENFSSEHKQYSLQPKDTLFLKMSNNDLIVNRKTLYRSNTLEEVKNENGMNVLYSSNVHVDIRKSSDEKMMVKVLKTSRGRNKEKALKKSESIVYQYVLEKNKLNLDAYFLSPLDLKFYRPRIDVIIYVPEDYVVYIDNSSSPFLDDVKNIQDIYDREMGNHYFLMDRDGFNCTDCIENEAGDLNIDVNTKGVNINIDNGKEQAKVKIDENGIEVN